MDLNLPLLLGNALLLGFRHGIDWDHIAAIIDITGTSAYSKRNHAHSFTHTQKHAFILSFMYAMGHAGVIVVLGIAALYFAASLPLCVDSFMERAVGVTLLILGVWVFYSLVHYLQAKDDFELRSRWMLIFAILSNLVNRLRSQVLHNAVRRESRINQYGVGSAFAVGAIHGVGAETGSQVLLIATVGTAATHYLGIAVLFVFVLGLLISSMLVSLFLLLGLFTSAGFKPIYITTGVLAGIFSLTVGCFFVSANSNQLPSLQHLIAAQTFRYSLKSE